MCKSNKSSTETGGAPRKNLISSGKRSVWRGWIPEPLKERVTMLSALQLGHVTWAVIPIGTSEIGVMPAPSRLDPHL